MKFTDYAGNEVDLPQVVNRTTAQLSAQERSKLTDAIIAQVGELTRQVNALTQTQNSALEWQRYQERSLSILGDRIDAMERLSVTRYADWRGRAFNGRLRWLLTGR